MLGVTRPLLPRRKGTGLGLPIGHGLSVLGPEGDRRLSISQDQPLLREERAAAVRARARRERPGLLAGLLYWKLTTKDYHAKVEPFALVIGSGVQAPLLEALQAFER